LTEEVELRVVYHDTTPFGSLLSRRLGDTIRARCAPAIRHMERRGMDAMVMAGPALLARSFLAGLGELYRDARRLREDVLYPPQRKVRPLALLALRRGQEVMCAKLPRALASDLARWIGEWARQASAPASSPARALFDALDGASAFEMSARKSNRAARLPACDGRFIGHATVSLGSGAAVVVDPFLQPTSPSYGLNYQPIAVRQLESSVAVCITHSHPDHYSLASLLRFGADTPIIVPRVARESALSIDMAARLTELGFRHVSALGWNESRRIPGGRITALPFFGEQPTTGERLHPEVRNEGNTYLVETNGHRFLLLADSGRDAAGDAVVFAESMRRRIDSIDVLFGGYRAFPVYPIEYLFSSVPSYLLFVPREAWGQRQRIMYNADELVDLAESWRARYVVPYASGGAPWYGVVSPELADPNPEDVLLAARRRAGPPNAPHASPVRVEILRPGDGFRVRLAALRVIRKAPYAWPTDRAAAPPGSSASDNERGARG